MPPSVFISFVLYHISDPFHTPPITEIIFLKNKFDTRTVFQFIYTSKQIHAINVTHSDKKENKLDKEHKFFFQKAKKRKRFNFSRRKRELRQ